MLLKLVTILSIVSNVFASIKDCNPNSIFRPTQLAVNPDPPIPGQPVKLTLVFDNPGSEISDGTITTSLSVNSIPISPSTQSLCDNTKCPILTGTNDRSTETTWPSVTGIIKSRIVWTGPNQEELLCIDTAFKVQSGNFWDIFNSIKQINKENKEQVYHFYKSFKKMADKNNLRGIINTISADTDE